MPASFQGLERVFSEQIGETGLDALDKTLGLARASSHRPVTRRPPDRRLAGPSSVRLGAVR